MWKRFSVKSAMQGISEDDMAVTDSSTLRARGEGIGAMSSCYCVQEAYSGGLVHIPLQATAHPGMSSYLGRKGQKAMQEILW